MDYFVPADAKHQKKHRAKAREMRKTNWWRQQLGAGKCYHCEQSFPKESLTMDHLIPIARGGETNKRNVVVSCKDCNSKKGHQTAVDLAFAELSGKSSSAEDS